MEIRQTGDEEYLRMTKFWGRLFVINFVIGVITGISLEFKFGYSVGNEYQGRCTPEV